MLPVLESIPWIFDGISQISISHYIRTGLNLLAWPSQSYSLANKFIVELRYLISSWVNGLNMKQPTYEVEIYSLAHTGSPSHMRGRIHATEITCIFSFFLVTFIPFLIVISIIYSTVDQLLLELGVFLR